MLVMLVKRALRSIDTEHQHYGVEQLGGASLNLLPLGHTRKVRRMDLGLGARGWSGQQCIWALSL